MSFFFGRAVWKTCSADVAAGCVTSVQEGTKTTSPGASTFGSGRFSRRAWLFGWSYTFCPLARSLSAASVVQQSPWSHTLFGIETLLRGNRPPP